MATSREKREKRERRVGSARRRAEQHGSGGAGAYLILPNEVKPFRPPEKGEEFEVDVLPYVIKDKGANPNAYDGDGEPLGQGDVYFERTFYVHRGVGPEMEKVICPKTFKKACPICKEVAKLKRDPDYNPREKGNAVAENVRALKASERQLFLVVPRAGEGKGKLHVWDVPYWFFGRFLDGKIQKSKAERGYDNFFDLKDGKTLQITPMESQLAKDLYEYPSISFLDRRAPLKFDEDDLPCLDEMLREVSYADVKKLFEQPPDEEEEEDVDEEEEEEEAPVVKKGGKKAKPARDEDEDEDEEEEVEPDEDEDDEEEDDLDRELKTMKNGQKGGKKKKPARASDDDDDDDEDEDEPDEEEEDEDEEDDEEPAVKRGKKKATAKSGKSRRAADEEDEDDEYDDEDDD